MGKVQGDLLCAQLTHAIIQNRLKNQAKQTKKEIKITVIADKTHK